MDWLLSRFGIGAAEFSVEFPDDEVTPGDSVEAEIEIEGGSAEQTGEHVATRVSATTTLGQSIAGADVPRYPTRSRMKALAKVTGTEDKVDPVLEYTMDWRKVTGELTIEPGERWTTTTTVDVPHSTPLTMGEIRVWIAGGMKILASRNVYSDRHYVDVVPDGRFEALFDAAAAMGMEYGGTKFHEDASPGTYTEDSPFTRSGYARPIQLFRFHPAEGRYADALDAVDLTALGTERGLEVQVELPGHHDGKRTVELTRPDADAVRAELEPVIDDLV